MTLLTSHEAAAQLGIGVKGVHKLVQRGTLRASRFGKSLAFLPADVERAKSRPSLGRPKKIASAVVTATPR
jgi:excisionase family DNA binding protein